MRMQNLRSHNELSEYKKLNLRLQGEVCRVNTDVDNLKQEISKRQNNVEQPKMNFQVNSSTHGTYINVMSTCHRILTQCRVKKIIHM